MTCEEAKDYNEAKKDLLEAIHSFQSSRVNISNNLFEKLPVQKHMLLSGRLSKT